MSKHMDPWALTQLLFNLLSMVAPAHNHISWLGAGFSAQLDIPPGQLHDPLTALLLYAHAYWVSRTGAMPAAHIMHIKASGLLWYLSSMSGNNKGGWKSRLLYSFQTHACLSNDSPIILAEVQLFTSNDLCQQSLRLGGKECLIDVFCTHWEEFHLFLCMWIQGGDSQHHVSKMNSGGHELTWQRACCKLFCWLIRQLPWKKRQCSN